MAITTTIKRLSAFLLPALLVCASFMITVVGSLPGPTTISSYGRMTSSQTSDYLYGVWVSDTSWRTYGSYWGYTQVDMVDQAGGNYICYAIDKRAWYENNDNNALGVPFQDYIKTLVDYGNGLEIASVLCLHIDLGFGDRDGDGRGWGSYEKNMQINDPTLREDWIQWGRDMIAYCNPWGVIVMDEPGRSMIGQPLTLQDYWDFANECVNEWSEVDPNIWVITYGGGTGGGQDGNRYLNQFLTNPLPQENVLYTTVLYGQTVDQDYQSSRQQGWQAVENWLEDHGVSGELQSKVIFTTGSISPWSGMEVFFEDMYGWCEANAFGMMQWACAKSDNYNLIDGNDRTQWSSTFGEIWRNKSP